MRLILKRARLAFSQNLFKAGAMDADSEPRFSSTFLFEKGGDDEELVNKVMSAVAAEKWQKKGESILKDLKDKGRVCMRDGNEKADYDGFEDHWYIQASARPDSPPKVVDRDKSILTADKGRPYAGCYVLAVIEVWAQDNKYGKRINAQLKGVQFIEDGDAFSGSAPARDEEFADIADTGEDLGEFC